MKDTPTPKLSFSAMDFGQQRVWETMRVDDVGFAQALHADYQWRKTRNEFIKLQPCCQFCGDHRKLQVHHALPWSLFPDYRYEHANLITLCQSRHLDFGHGHNWKNFNPNIFKMASLVQASTYREVNWGTYENDQSWIDDVLGSINLEPLRKYMV